MQVFGCKLNPGKSMADVMAPAEAYRSKWSSMKIADKGAGAFVWTSFREGTPYDYIVGFLNTSLKDSVASLESYYGSGVGAGLDAQSAAPHHGQLAYGGGPTAIRERCISARR